MINYYFGSKKGILKEIIEVFFEEMNKNLDINNIKEKPFEDRIRIAIKSLVNVLKKNEKLFKIIMLYIPETEKDLIKLRREKLKNIILRKIFIEKFKGFDSNIRYEIIGPALSGMIFSHFLLKDVIPNITERNFDNDFYDIYPDYIADIYLYGVLNKIKKEM
ncbi:hypothetical protein JCM30566_14280 [Marinitoga arctica]